MSSAETERPLGRIWRALAGRTVLPFAVGFAVVMVFVFWEALPVWQVITSPDDAPFHARNAFAGEVERWLADRDVFMWQRLFRAPAPLAWHEFSYMACLFWLGLSGVFYLRTQRAHRVAAWGGGLFLALSGYMCTLFSAGHLGFFYLMASVFWSLGLIARALERRDLRLFALLGCAVMWGQAGQPDVWVLAMAVVAAYVLWRLLALWRGGLPARRLLLEVCPRFALTAVVAAALGVGGIRQVFQQHLAGRDRQIAEASGQRQAGGALTAQSAADRWHFATGWSLPPEDCAEFLVPGVFGNDSFRAPYPYWGRLGRSHAFEAGKMMPNYRQHTVYLGLVSLILAGFAVSVWMAGRRRRPVPEENPPGVPVSDVPFWCGVWIVALLLAMGRYTPVYRLFYALPYMDYLRAPVKFLHLTEVATALLAGFGLNALLSVGIAGKTRRSLFLAVSVLAGILVLAALLATGAGTAIERHIASLGFGALAPALRGYTVYNCWRAAGLAAAAAGVLWFVGSRAARGGRPSATAVAVLVLLGAADLALVARRYVIPMDARPFHAENAIVREVRRRTGERPAMVANYVTRNAWGQDWLNTALAVHGFNNPVPGERGGDSPQARFFAALQNDPLRFWRLTGVRFLLLPRAQAEPLARQGVLSPLGEYVLGAGTVGTARGSADAVVLGELRDGGLPKVFYRWRGGVARDDQVAAVLDDSSVPVSDAPPPAAQSARPPQPAALTRGRGEAGVLVTRASVALEEPGLFVWPEPFDPVLVAFVDGREEPLYRADGLWCALALPAGEHDVAVRMRRRPLQNGVIVALSAAAAVSFLFGRGRCVARGG